MSGIDDRTTPANYPIIIGIMVEAPLVEVEDVGVVPQVNSDSSWPAKNC